MELGISMFGDLSIDPKTQRFQSPQERLQQLLEEIKLADEVGLDVFGIGEHHRIDYAVSSPEILLAAAAGITNNIKLTSAVTVLSSSDPVRIYQNFSMLDSLSNGRAEITVGRGSFIESFPLFGYDLQDYNELFSERLDLLLQINQQTKPLDWKGKFRPDISQQTVYPRSTKPLDIWIAVGGTTASVVRAARLGLPLIVAIIGGNPAQFQPMFQLYKQEYISAGHDLSKMRLATHAHGILGDDINAVLDRYFPKYADKMNRIGRERGWPPMTRQQFDASRQPNGAYFMGNQNEVIDKILSFQEMFGLTRFVLHADSGAPDHKDLMRSIEIFGTKIAPAIKKALS